MNRGDLLLSDLDEFKVKELDRWLPVAIVARIMKTTIPQRAEITKEATEVMQECVSEFTSFISEAENAEW
jgi:nuclear transcription Y subunit beta